MNNIYALLKSIESLTEISPEVFQEILTSYNITENAYRDSPEISPDDSSISNLVNVFDRNNRQYFTISSKTDFNELISTDNLNNWDRTLIYHPLNNHSRDKLKKGDVLFCYRQGQFKSLSDALENRGIYGIGIAATDPLEIFPNKEDYNRYAVVVCFPFLLAHHLQLRNIQMHPNTIDLTPYNGNRNDALQHIPEESHYKTLLGLTLKNNPQHKLNYELILNTSIENFQLPDEIWNSRTPSTNDVTIDDKLNLNSFSSVLENSGLIFSESIIKRFVVACLTKPFVILSGLSGSGKTMLALLFAKWICVESTNYCLVPVGADWTNREPLLGYPNALDANEYVKPDNGVIDLLISANENPRRLHFLILDEMNLSHVERYFADFLSAMESKQPIALHANKEEMSAKDGTKVPSKITLPENLFIVGTVNIDETTYMFSPKVLDRASVIEFRVGKNEMQSFFDSIMTARIDGIDRKGASMGVDFLQKSSRPVSEISESAQIKLILAKFFKELQTVGAEFGYRTASEILGYAYKVRLLEEESTSLIWKVEEIIDTAVVQKLLPKLHGSRKKLIPVLQKLAELCVDNPEDVDLIHYEEQSRAKKGKILKVVYPISFGKICRMYDSAVQDGFTSFAEA